MILRAKHFARIYPVLSKKKNQVIRLGVCTAKNGNQDGESDWNVFRKTVNGLVKQQKDHQRGRGAVVQGNRGGGGRDGGGEGREGEEVGADGKEPKDKFYFFYLLLFKI